MSTPKFKIKGTTYDFQDIDLQKYYVLQDILNKAEKGSEYDVVELVTGCPKSDLRQLKYSDWLILWDECQIHIYLNTRTTESIQPIIKFEGKEYSLPKIEDMTVGEFADLDIIFSAPNADKRLNEIAAILYRPIKKRVGELVILEDYDASASTERAEAFKRLPLAYIRSANSFFLQYANRSLESIVDSLIQSEPMKMLPPKDQENLKSLLQPDLGGNYSIPFLEKVLSDFKTLQLSRSEQHSTGYLGKKIKSVKQIWKSKKLLVK